MEYGGFQEDVFNNLFEMRKEVHTFLEEQHSPLAEHYTDDQFCAKLAYLSDIFDQLNQLKVYQCKAETAQCFWFQTKLRDSRKK